MLLTKILKLSLTAICLAGCVDLEGAKLDLIQEMEESFTRCEEKIDALAERLAICEQLVLLHNTEEEE